jgi:hypothetical protein
MDHSLRLRKISWSIATAAAFFSALAGVLSRDIYVNLFPADFLPGAFAQDVLTLLVCVVLFVLIAVTKENDVKKQVVIVGLIGSFFYLYGICTIERVYNACYLLYATAFAASFWSLIYSVSRFRNEAFAGLQLSAGMRITTAVSSIIIAIIFTVLWTAALIPLMREHNRIEFLYSIYILDLCFVMPAFFITAVMALRRQPVGILLGPAMMIMGFFVIFPLGLNELAKPSAGMPMHVGPLAVSFTFSIYMLALAVRHLRMVLLPRS